MPADIPGVIRASHVKYQGVTRNKFVTAKKKTSRRKKSPGRPRKKRASAKKTSNKKSLNVEGMSLNELKKLEAELQKAQAEAREKLKKEMKKKIDALLEGSGMTVFDIYGFGQGKKRGKSSTGVAKYANPDDPGDTWTGRGRKPNWVLAQLKKGAKLEQFAI